MTGDPRRREAGKRERERLVNAFTKVASERGYEQTSVGQVAAVAGLPRSTFYVHFASKRQCLSAAHDAFFGRLLDEVASAVDDEQEWPLRVKAAVAAALEFVDETARRSRFFAIDVLVAGPLIVERHSSALGRAEPLLREGREHFPEAADLPELTEVVLIGGAAFLLCRSLLAEERLRVSRLATEMVEMLLVPYVGRGEARRIAA